jgi:hypothetical protein
MGGAELDLGADPVPSAVNDRYVRERSIDRKICMNRARPYGR